MNDNAKMTEHAAIGQRLRQIRNYFGLSQKDFAARHGFPRTRYNHWERGIRRISLDCAYVLNKCHGVTLDFIYLGRDATLPDNLRKAFSSSPSDNLHKRSRKPPVS